MEILVEGMTVRHGMTEGLWTNGLRLLQGKQHMFGPSDSAGLGNHFFTQHIYVHSVRLVEGHFYRYMCIIYIYNIYIFRNCSKEHLQDIPNICGKTLASL